MGQLGWLEQGKSGLVGMDCGPSDCDRSRSYGEKLNIIISSKTEARGVGGIARGCVIMQSFFLTNSSIYFGFSSMFFVFVV